MWSQPFRSFSDLQSPSQSFRAVTTNVRSTKVCRKCCDLPDRRADHSLPGELPWRRGMSAEQEGEQGLDSISLTNVSDSSAPPRLRSSAHWGQVSFVCLRGRLRTGSPAKGYVDCVWMGTSAHQTGEYPTRQAEIPRA